MTRNNLYGFKKRDNLPHEALRIFCSHEGIRIDYIVNGTLPIYEKETSMVAEQQKPYPQIVKISDPLIQKTAAILESPTIFSTALKSNIEAFHHALVCEQQLGIAIKRIEVLEEWKKAIEARLPAVNES